MAAILGLGERSKAACRHPVLLIDLHCYTPPEEYKVGRDDTERLWRDLKMYPEEDIDFCKRVADRSGLSPTSTHLPPAINPNVCADKPRTDLEAADLECREAVFGAVEGLLEKTGLQARDIDILVSTCSIYCPTPSMASMIVNRFKLKQDVQSYHLGGMGCANGVVGTSLVRDLLQAHPNVNALFVTTEVTTSAFYPGKDRARMVTNILFRMGAAAVLFSNKQASWNGRVKYKLDASKRVHMAGSEDAYTAIVYGPDSRGINGIYLGKNVVTEASKALTSVLWSIGPQILTVRQKLEFVVDWIQRHTTDRSAKPKLPKFNESVQHFLIHAGGAKVLDGIQKALLLNDGDLKASRDVLWYCGNVSSSTTWYTLSNVESRKGVKRGEKVMQIGVGSGIKCGVNIWKATRDVREVHAAWRHVVSDEEWEKHKTVLPAKPFVDVSQLGLVWLSSRAWFFAIMCVLMAVVHAWIIWGPLELRT